MQISPNDIWGTRIKVGEIIDFSVLLETSVISPEALSLEEHDLEIAAWKDILKEAHTHHSLGFPDFLPFSFLEHGLQAGMAVCCLFQKFSGSAADRLIDRMNESEAVKATAFRLFDLNDKANPQQHVDDMLRDKIINHASIPYGTAFLVGKNYVLTNHHLVPEKALLSNLEAHFLYEKDALRRCELEKDNRVIYRFNPDFYYPCRDLNLDYVLLELQPLKEEDKKSNYLSSVYAGDNFSYLRLPKLSQGEIIRSSLSGNELTSVLDSLPLDSLPEINRIGLSEIPGEGVNIIQHPEGRPKEIVIWNNRVQQVYQDIIEYETDTEPGSSGSPLLNQNWQLIGLHRGARLKPARDGSQNGKFEIQSFVGIRASSIVRDLHAQINKPNQDQDIVALSRFFKQWVDHETVTGRVFLIAGRDDRTKILTSEDATTEKTLMLKLRNLIQQKMPENSTARLPLISVAGQSTPSTLDSVIQETNQAGVAGDIAIEFQMNAATEPKQELLLYYSAVKNDVAQQIKKLTEIIDKNSPYEVTLIPDRDTIFGSLRFCRRITIPALVLFVGDVAEPDWVENNLEALAENIASVLKNWLTIADQPDSYQTDIYS